MVSDGIASCIVIFFARRVESGARVVGVVDDVDVVGGGGAIKMATPPPPPSSSTTLASMGWRRRRSGRRAGPASTSASERRPLATDCSRRAGRRGSVSTPSAAGSPVDRRRSCPPDENQKQKKTWLMVDRVTSACLSFRVGRRLEIECRKKNKKTNKQKKITCWAANRCCCIFNGFDRPEWLPCGCGAA